MVPEKFTLLTLSLIFSFAKEVMDQEDIDKLIHNAKRLGDLAYVVDLFNRRGYFTTETQEYKYRCYCDVYIEQQRLLNHD